MYAGSAGMADINLINNEQYAVARRDGPRHALQGLGAAVNFR